MLRIFVNTTISCMLLMATSGITISEHYCGNKLVSVSINSEADSCCNKECGCCHNESVHFQLAESFIATTSIFNFNNNHVFDLLGLDNNIYNIIIHKKELKDNVFISESPPPKRLNTLLSQLQKYLL